MERRSFLRGGVGAAVLGANDRLRVAQIGCGGRGSYEMRVCSGFPDVEIVAVADVYPPLIEKARATLGGKPEGYADFRRILDRKDIDAVFVSTPDHWHAIPSILACQAGKDVYCEKPLTHTIREGQAMVKAARRHKCVVQTGSQQRSARHFQKVVELVQGGHIGKVSLVECWNAGNDAPNGYGNPPDEPAPQGLDWDMFLGPAPKVPYNRNRYHFNYRWFWDYSGGMMTDWGAHHFDIVQWAMNVEGPLSASAVGGRFCSRDNCQTPDTLMTVLEYPGFIARYMLRQGNAAALFGRTYGMAFHGTNGTLVVDRSGYEVLPEIEIEGRTSDFDRLEAFLKGGERAAYTGLNRKAEPKRTPRCEPLKELGLKIDPECQIAHVRNFLDCVKSRKRPVAEVEIGHRSITACHVGVIAYKLGRTVRWDVASERFPNDAEAQAMTTKKYRSPWVLPEV